MKTTKTERTDEATPAPQNDSETATAKGNELVAIRENCLLQLTAISVRVQQLSQQLSADWTREQQESLKFVKDRQQSLALDYMHKVRLASTQSEPADDMAAFSQRCAEDFEVSRRDALKSLEGASAKLRSAYDAGIADANRDWDAACTEFVTALRQQLETKTADPTHVAAIGGGLTWIASMMRRPLPNA